MIEKIADFAVSNIAWEIIVFFAFIFFIFLKAITLSVYLLKENRYTMGNGYGKHKADRFIDIYYSNKENPLRYGERSNALIKQVGDVYVNQDFIDNELIKQELVEKNSEILCRAKGRKKIFRNKLVIFFLEFYLVNFIGDKKAYYKNLQKKCS